MTSIITGIRTATIGIVATATIAPLAGVATLGEFILGENVYGANGVLAGAIWSPCSPCASSSALAGAAAAADFQGPEAEGRMSCPKHTRRHHQ